MLASKLRIVDAGDGVNWQGLGVPSFARFLQMGQKKTPQLSHTLHGKSAQLADTLMGKVTLKGSSFTLSNGCGCARRARRVGARRRGPR